MFHYPTNQQETFKFIAFMTEGLNYIDAWTPTRINNGGCGVFAKALADKLDELKIEYQIVVLVMKTRSEKETKLLKEATDISEKKKQDMLAVDYDHYLIQIGDLFFDSNGIENALVNTSTADTISKADLEKFLTMDIWNPVYDHGCDPFIKEKMAFIFDKYDEFKRGYFPMPKNGVKYTAHTRECLKKEQARQMFGMFGF